MRKYYGVSSFVRQRQMIYGGLLPPGRIMEWNEISVFVCDSPSCGNFQIFWIEGMNVAYGKTCPLCMHHMTLRGIPMNKAREHPKLWARIEHHAKHGW